jgi:hypothetical protein
MPTVAPVMRAVVMGKSYVTAAFFASPACLGRSRP